VPVHDTQALMDLVLVAVVVVPEVFAAAVAVLEDVEAVVELLELVEAVLAAEVVAVVDAAVAVLVAVVLAAVVVAAVVAAVVLAAVDVPVVAVVEVRVMLPLTEPVVAAVVVAAVVVAAVVEAAVVAVVVLAAVVLAVVASEVVEAAVVVPVELEVPLDEPSLELPQPASAKDMVNAQGRISRFAARLAEASAYDDSSCTCAARACSVRKISFDNFAISPISTIPRARLCSEVQTTEIKSRGHLYVIRDKPSKVFIYGVTLCAPIL
jgi:hypothetical protein